MPELPDVAVYIESLERRILGARLQKVRLLNPFLLRTAVPPIAMKNLIPLPPDLPSDLATVADPFACALNGMEQLDVRLGDTVVIMGTGPIGCWQAVMARDSGASRVFLTDVSGERLKITAARGVTREVSAYESTRAPRCRRRRSSTVISS